MNQESKTSELLASDEPAQFGRNLANRMHDHLQQYLAAARMRAGVIRLQSAGKSPSPEGIAEIEQLLEKAMEESTAIIRDLKARS
jgi:signal transduction histidine kinase